MLNTDGDVELDAMIMEGKTLSAGAVSSAINVANPVSLARAVMEKVQFSPFYFTFLCENELIIKKELAILNFLSFFMLTSLYIVLFCTDLQCNKQNSSKNSLDIDKFI